MSAQSHSNQRVRIYTPDPFLRKPWILLGGLRDDIWSGRELAWRLFVRDLNAQYRQTYFGYLWVLFPPLASSFAFIFLQRQGLVAFDTGRLPYPLFAFMGTVIWQTFVDAISSPATALNGAKALLAKINFPREALLLAGLYSVTFHLLVRLGLVGIAMAWAKVAPGPLWWFLPLALAAVVMAGFAVGLLLCPLGGLYGDVTRAVPILAQFWMLLSPVVYPLSAADNLHDILRWNPATPLIVTAREALAGGTFTLLPEFWVVTGGALVFAFAGLLSFRVALPHIIARVGS